MPEPAVCPDHPKNRAVFSCCRCGKRMCRLCVGIVNGRNYCARHKQEAMVRNYSASRAPDLPASRMPGLSGKRYYLALWLLALGGFAGAHRLYLGRTKSALFRLLAFVVALVSALCTPLARDRGFAAIAPVFALLIVLSGLAEFSFGVHGLPGFVPRSLLRVIHPEWGKGRRRRLAKLRGGTMRRPLPSFDSFLPDAMAVPVLVGLGMGLFMFLLLLSGEPLQLGYAFFMIASSLVGSMLCRDVVYMYWNSLTDVRGDLLQ